MMNRTNRYLIVALVAAVAIICCCAAACLVVASLTSCQPPQGAWATATPTAQAELGHLTSTATPEVVRIVASPTPSPTSAVAASAGHQLDTLSGTATPPSASAPEAQSPLDAATEAVVVTPTTAELMGSTIERLAEVVVPTRDLRDLALRLRPDLDDIPRVVNLHPPEYQEGDVETFWVGNMDTQEHRQIQAVLRVRLPHLHMWVEEGVRVDLEDLRRSARRFEEQTYPTVRAFFGSEWTPGVDNDVRLTVLNATELGDRVAGYFSSADEFSRIANPYSNEREMFYINLDNNPPGATFYDGTLAHEFQHMIHWANDRNEETWVNEGMSELATELCGFSRGGADVVFSGRPDTQLTTWSDDPDVNSAHYGASYLFMSYFLDRFGDELTRAVVASPANGTAGFDEALLAAGTGLTFDDVFADWLIANYLDSTTLEDGRYGYQRDNPRQVAMEKSHRQYPVTEGSTVQQYAADYYELTGRGDVTITFCGETETRLAATEAYSGSYAWWSHRGDDSNARLTRAFDLSGLTEATLEFWAWHHIEEGYDYGYVVVSTDGGTTWTILDGQQTRDLNPVGNAFGEGYTGMSGDPTAAEWVWEQIDLTPYVGQEVLVRFEYVTDDAVNYPGWFVDDISVPQLGFFDDGESGSGGWIDEGWVLIDAALPQRWLVQVIEKGVISALVHRMVIEEDGCGQIAVDDVGLRGRKAILVISALAPITTEEAAYAFEVHLR